MIKASACHLFHIWPSFFAHGTTATRLVLGSRIKLHSVAWMQSISVIPVFSKWKHLKTKILNSLQNIYYFKNYYSEKNHQD